MPILPTCVLDARIECRWGSQQGFKRRRASHVRRVPEGARVAHRKRSDGRVCLRTVDEGDALFGAERERREAGLGEHGCGGPNAVAPMERPFADKGARQGCERRQVATGAHGALFRDWRPEVGI